jgi:glycosyltransferase involved in cell wall biosynthesis
VKVVLMIRSLDQGGAQRQLSVLATGLHDRGDEVVVVTAVTGGKFADELSAAGVRLESFHKGRSGDLRYLVRLHRLLRREAADIVACYVGDSNVLGGLYKLTAPRRTVVMGLRNDRPNIFAGNLLGQAIPTLERLLSRVVDGTVVNSERGAANARRRGFPPDRLHQIDNGIDTALFRPNREERVLTRSEWGIADDEILIGYVGRLHRQKGVPVLLRAWADVAERVPQARFVCIGKTQQPEYTEGLHTLASVLGLHPPRLTWLPVYADMPAAYNAFDMLVSASHQEGFANNVAESLACGTPCVVTDVGDNGRVVGDPDLVVPPGDPVALAEACNKALESRLPAGRDALRSRVLGFGVDDMVERTRALYLQLLGQS